VRCLPIIARSRGETLQCYIERVICRLPLYAYEQTAPATTLHVFIGGEHGAARDAWLEVGRPLTTLIP
jgi:hypothetical protein